MENKTVAMYFALIFVCCVALVSGFLGYNSEVWPGNWRPASEPNRLQMTECQPIHPITKPCDSFIARFHHNGTFVEYAPSSPRCLCKKTRLCPPRNRKKNNVLLRLFSEKFIQRLKMVFCTQKRLTRECKKAEKAILVKGINAPTHVEAFYCKCSPRQNLTITRRWTEHRTSERTIREEYVCENHMHQCKLNDMCMAENSYQYFIENRNPTFPFSVYVTEANFPCKCSGSLRCRPHPESNPKKDSVIYGYCQV